MNKTMLISLFMLLFGTIIQAQVKIGENGSPTKGALLDLNGTYKGGLLLPNVAITDLGTIPAGFTERGGADKAADLTGMIVWSTDPVNSGLYMWDGDNWQSLMCNEKVSPCTGPAPAPTAITIPAGPFANGETFEVSCMATEDGTTFYIWTAPTGLSITAGQGTKTIRVLSASGTFDKNKFTVFAVNQCAQSATKDGGTGQITVTAALTPGTPSATSVEIPSGGTKELDAGTPLGGNCASYSYQWQSFNSPNWQNIAGATGAKYTTPALTSNTQYRRITTCGTETATSATITVTIKQVTEPSSVTATPSSICNGNSTTLSATDGSGSTFVWYTADCGDTQVGTGTSLSDSPETTTTYWGRWESGSSVSTCKSVTVTVVQPVTPTVTISGNTSVALNTDVTFTAVASGVTYQWKVDGSNVSGATGSSLVYQWAVGGNYTVECTVTSTDVCSRAVDSNLITVAVADGVNSPCGCNEWLNTQSATRNLNYRSHTTTGYCIAWAEVSTLEQNFYSGKLVSGAWTIDYNLWPQRFTSKIYNFGSCGTPYMSGVGSYFTK